MVPRAAHPVAFELEAPFSGTREAHDRFAFPALRDLDVDVGALHAESMRGIGAAQVNLYLLADRELDARRRKAEALGLHRDFPRCRLLRCRAAGEQRAHKSEANSRRTQRHSSS